MAAFEPDEAWSDRVNWWLLAYGSVTLFRQPQLLAEKVAWLEQHDYRVLQLDAASWAGPSSMLTQLGAAFDFPGDYRGRSLDAFDDHFGNVALYEHEASPDRAGTALVLDRFDGFVAREPAAAHALLDIFADAARLGLLIGYRMMCLVRSDDPGLTLPAIGATPVRWNNAESPASRRRSTEEAG